MITLSTRMRLTTCLLLASAATAAAGGFSIFEAGARATGMGCAVTASVADGSAMFYNIAGISFMDGTVVDLNLMPIAPKNKFLGIGDPDVAATAETVDQTFLVPGLGVTHNTGNAFAFGLGVSAPFGLGVEWQAPETFSGRFSSYDVGIATVYITPAVSYKVSSKLALAMGLDIATQSLHLNRFAGQRFGGPNEMENVIRVELEGDSDINVTPCFGLMFKPAPEVSVGVMYHHEKTMNFEGGTGTLTNVAPAGSLHDTVDPLAGEYDLSTEVGLPHMLSLGVAYQIHERLLVEFDAVHFGWSNFEELALTFDPDGAAGMPLSSTVHERYEDRWQNRIGFAYQMRTDLTLLGGYVYDRTPQPKASMTPLLPDATRNDWSIGAEYTTGPWRFTGAWMTVLNDKRNNIDGSGPALFPEEATDSVTVLLKTEEAGSYSTVANVFALGVGYHF